jgi:twitching motility protein PilI
MANREALRELQTRLASRLQAARSESVSVAWLAVRVGEVNCLFPLSQSGEIFPLPSIQVVPYAQTWFLGVVNLRGALFGVVDLAQFMGDKSIRARTEQSLSEASVITFNTALDINCALMVDELAGLRKREAFAEAGPAPVGSPVYFGSQLKDLSGVLWQEINLQTLSQVAEFLSISA